MLIVVYLRMPVGGGMLLIGFWSTRVSLGEAILA